jgi:hypothetical protein
MKIKIVKPLYSDHWLLTKYPLGVVLFRRIMIVLRKES